MKCKNCIQDDNFRSIRIWPDGLCDTCHWREVSPSEENLARVRKRLDEIEARLEVIGKDGG